jgi:hypothetical protein
MSQRTEHHSNLAERVRAACVDAALAAYEDAGIRGLCADGRWEAALAAIRDVDLSRVLELRADSAHDDSV